MSEFPNWQCIGESSLIDQQQEQAFDYQTPYGVLPIFVIVLNGECRAYVNHCPHRGLSLNWQPHQFLTEDHTLIQCSVHGALFKPESGKCIHGACVGTSLIRLEIKKDQDRYWVRWPQSAPSPQSLVRP